MPFNRLANKFIALKFDFLNEFLTFGVMSFCLHFVVLKLCICIYSNVKRRLLYNYKLAYNNSSYYQINNVSYQKGCLLQTLFNNICSMISDQKVSEIAEFYYFKTK